MVVAALAFESETFDVGVDIFGVTNWLRTLESMPAWWGAQRDALLAEMGDPATDRDRLEHISPLFHADRIQRPMLVIQGRNDPRVLQVESDELVEKMRANDVAADEDAFALGPAEIGIAGDQALTVVEFLEAGEVADLADGGYDQVAFDIGPIWVSERSS